MHVGDLFGATGVYVLWDARAKARPTYIGEGHILHRLASHSQRDGRRFAKPIDGYVAIIEGSTRGVHKTESQVVERLLLDVAKRTDREPSVNVRPGAASVVHYLCKASPTVRVAVKGWDPLVHPSDARPLSGTREIKARLKGYDDYEISHSWRVRRLRGPIT
jgi:hypothetical protein